MSEHANRKTVAKEERDPLEEAGHTHRRPLHDADTPQEPAHEDRQCQREKHGHGEQRAPHHTARDDSAKGGVRRGQDTRGEEEHGQDDGERDDAGRPPEEARPERHDEGAGEQEREAIDDGGLYGEKGQVARPEGPVALRLQHGRRGQPRPEGPGEGRGAVEGGGSCHACSRRDAPKDFGREW